VKTALAALILGSIGNVVWADSIIGVPVGYTPGAAPLVRIDPITSTYTVLHTTGRSYHALAQDSQGDVYGGYFNVTAENGRVARFDLTSGAQLEIFNAVTPGAGDIRGLAFDAADQLFAVVNRNDQFGSPTINDDLYRIDLATQTTQLIGSLGRLGVQGFDIAPNGTFYAWDGFAGLLTVDPVTGATTDVNPSNGGTASIQSIVFAPDGRLFGAREQLFSIDPETGAYSAIGTGDGIDRRGIEWIVPEPPSCLLFAIAWLSSVASNRRRVGKPLIL
jgi:hypothetical protein